MTEEIHVKASVGGRPLTLEPIRVIPVTIEVREVESTIPCGLQIEWVSGTTPDDKPIELTAGAGMGSRWGTIHYGGRGYCFEVNQLLGAFVDAAKEATP